MLSEVWKGRKENGRARMLRARANRPPPRTVPSSIVQKGFEPHTHGPCAQSNRERRVIRAWDNKRTTGEIVVWNRETCMSNLHQLARKSGNHVHDGPARHDIRPVQAGECRAERARDKDRNDATWRAQTIKRTENLGFAKELARERREQG